MNFVVTDAVNRGLRERISLLEEENRQLKDRLGIGAASVLQIDRVRKLFGVQPGDARMLLALVSAPMVRKADALVVCSPNGWDCVGEQLAVVRVSRLRRALRPHGFSVETVYGVGWCMAPEQQEAIKAMIGLGQGGAA